MNQEIRRLQEDMQAPRALGDTAARRVLQAALNASLV